MTPPVPTDLESCFAHLASLQKHLRLCEEQYQAARTLAMPPEVQQALDAVDAACLPQLGELQAALSQAEAQLKVAVLATGHSAKGAGYHAVYTPGKIRWDDAFLQGYAAVHDEILQGRLEGEPYVTLRREPPH
jgi:glycine cleavage system pyridoxal-binding protein P